MLRYYESGLVEVSDPDSTTESGGFEWFLVGDTIRLCRRCHKAALTGECDEWAKYPQHGRSVVDLGARELIVTAYGDLSD